jgi:hypothetical protein
MNKTKDWRRNLIIAGTLIGAVVGLGTSYLLVRTAEESNGGQAPKITTSDAIKVALGVIGTARGIAALGNNS